MRKSKQFRTGINITKAKNQFKSFFLITLGISLILSIMAHQYYPDFLLTGALIGVVTLLFTISHLLYVRSRDKLEIIDYFSLKYHLHIDSWIIKIFRFFRYMKAHLKSFIMILLILTLLQITWIFTVYQVSDFISFSAIGFFIGVEKIPYELKFISYQRNAVLDSVRSDEVISKYTKRLKQLGNSEATKSTYDYLMNEIEKEQRIQRHHHELLMRTTVIYNATLYFIFLIIIEVIGLISWTQWLNFLI